MSNEKVIEAYFKLSNHIATATQNFEAKLRPYQDKLAELDAVLSGMPLTPEEIVILYRDNDARNDAEQAVAKAKKAYRDNRAERLELAGLALANAQGVDSFATPSGTMYKRPKDYVKITDWDAVLEFIRTHEAWEYLNRVVNKPMTVAYAEAHGQFLPGTEVVKETVMGFRAPTKKRSKSADTEAV